MISCPAQESDDLKVAETNPSELAAFVSYAVAFPTAFQSLVDTYDVSGVLLVDCVYLKGNTRCFLLASIVSCTAL